jgi:hypothetical protein
VVRSSQDGCEIPRSRGWDVPSPRPIHEVDRDRLGIDEVSRLRAKHHERQRLDLSHPVCGEIAAKACETHDPDPRIDLCRSLGVAHVTRDAFAVEEVVSAERHVGACVGREGMIAADQQNLGDVDLWLRRRSCRGQDWWRRPDERRLALPPEQRSPPQAQLVGKGYGVGRGGEKSSR